MERATIIVDEKDETIDFYRCFLPHQSYSNAQVLKRSRRHEGNYGMTLRNRHASGHALYIETKEHAENMIKALTEAIARGWLFSEADIDKYRERVTDTTETLIRNREYENA